LNQEPSKLRIMILRLFSLLCRLCCLGLLLLLGPSLFAQVTGHAFLMGESNHQGIRVIFSPVSITGEADTVFTNASGQYSAAIIPGVYEIAFDKSGFNPAQYAGGQAQVLSGNDTLLDVTLNTLYFKNVSGNIRDTLYADTIYIATGNLTVSAGQHLYLEAGTHLWFNGPFSLTVNGNFDAVGTANNPVFIGIDSVSNPGLQWEVIEINGGTDTLHLEHCRIFGGEDGIKITDVPFVKARFNLFFDSKDGIWFKGNTSTLFAENEMTGLTNVCLRIQTNSNTDHQLYCNYLHDAAATGFLTLQSYGDIDILSNTFVNLPGTYGGALDLVIYEGDVLVEDNAAINTTVGLKLLVVDSTISTTTIRNNLFYGNNTGMWLRAGDGGAVIQMNAVMNNNIYGVAQPYPPGGTPDVFSYNLVAGSPDDYYNLNIPGVGNLITANANGTPSDAYLNIADPGTYDPLLSVIPTGTTPLLNAGDPLAPLDNDGSVSDIGIRLDNYCFTSYQGYAAAVVFPGDANFNQVANAWDLLTIGQHYGSTGPARISPSLAWQGQLAADWGTQQGNGEDLKHADCNGDGLIDAQDTTAILVNYQSVHTATSNRMAAGGVPLYFDMPSQPGNPGDTLIVPLHLGKVDTPAVDIYGMALAIEYDSSMIKPGGVWVEFDSSWVGNMGTEMIALQKDLFAQQRIDLAFTRIDQQDQTGYGRIANIIIVLDEDIGKTQLPMTLTIQDLEANDHAGNLLAVQGRSATMMVDTDPNTSTPIDPVSTLSLQLYPNPSHAKLQVALAGEAQLQGWQLMNQEGQILRSAATSPTQTVQIPTLDLSAGLYLLRLITDRGLLTRKVMVQH
jgi:hypothetical protein